MKRFRCNITFSTFRSLAFFLLLSFVLFHSLSAYKLQAHIDVDVGVRLSYKQQFNYFNGLFYRVESDLTMCKYLTHVVNHCEHTQWTQKHHAESRENIKTEFKQIYKASAEFSKCATLKLFHQQQ